MLFEGKGWFAFLASMVGWMGWRFYGLSLLWALFWISYVLSSSYARGSLEINGNRCGFDDDGQLWSLDLY